MHSKPSTKQRLHDPRRLELGRCESAPPAGDVCVCILPAGPAHLSLPRADAPSWWRWPRHFQLRTLPDRLRCVGRSGATAWRSDSTPIEAQRHAASSLPILLAVASSARANGTDNLRARCHQGPMRGPQPEELLPNATRDPQERVLGVPRSHRNGRAWPWCPVNSLAGSGLAVPRIARVRVLLGELDALPCARGELLTGSSSSVPTPPV